jgi:parallel beta-helix repeat protein
MRKFLKHFPFNKLFVSLFVILYTFAPSAQAMRVVAEDISTQVDTSEDILDEGISDPAEIANPNVSEDEVIQEVVPEVEEVVAEVKEPLFTYVDGVYTVNKVVVNEEYVYPDNSNVRVKFTSITEEGNLVISKVLLTEEEKSLLNTSDDYGWDISSSMTNGSFKYDLTLPNNTNSNDVEVKYSEDGNTYESIDDNLIVNENVIEIKGLEHFTVFVVVDPTPVPVGSDCTVMIGTTNRTGSCYPTIQQAVTAASNGETIYVASGIYEEGYISINNKSVNLIGDNATIKATSSDATAVITINNATTPMSITGFTIDAENVSGRSGIYIQNGSSNVTVDDNNIINFKDKGVLISSGDNNSVLNNTITSTSDANAGIYVDNNSGNNTISGNTITLPTTLTLDAPGNPPLNYDIWFTITIPSTVMGNNIVTENILLGGTRAFQQDSPVTGTTTFSNNTIGETISPSWAGVSINGGSAIITGNFIKNSVRPIEFTGSGEITITGNTIDDTTYDFINIGSGFTGTLNPIQHNSFLNMSSADLHNRTTKNVDATENYWGDLDPSDNMNNSNISGGSIDYSPWWGENYLGDSHSTGWNWYTNDSIQEAIDVANSGDTINVTAGTYQEQVIINKSLTLQGTDNPIIIAPSSPISFKFSESSKTWEPVVFAFGGTADGTATSQNITGTGTIQVTISGFTVDGNDRVPTANRSAGILLRNANGTISNNTIKNMSIDGKETFGIVANGNSNVTISENNVSGYARGGIGANGDGGSLTDPVAIIKNNTVTGPGKDEVVTWAPNGIQIGWGATGEITSNTVSGNGWPGTDWTGSGILVHASSDVEVNGNTVEGNETGIAVSGTSNKTLIHNNIVNENTSGISIQDWSVNTTIEKNTVTNSTYDGIDICNFYGNPPTGTVIRSNTITGNNTEDDETSGGIWIDDGVDGDEVSINLNNITSNNKFGILNTSTTNVADATQNWWGDLSGPSGKGSGSGDAVSDNVKYCPWLDAEDGQLFGPCIDYYNPVIESVTYFKNSSPITEQGTATDPVYVKSVSELSYNASFSDDLKLGKHVFVIYDENQDNPGTPHWTGNGGTAYCSFGGTSNTFSLEGTEDSLENISFVNCTNELPEGRYVVVNKVYDAVGKFSESYDLTFVVDKTTPIITDLTVDKNYVKAGDTLTITAKVTDSSGIEAVSADFSYNPEYTSTPTPAWVGMTETEEGTYSVSYPIPSSWNDGIMYIKVAARDNTGGNWVRTPSTAQVIVDNIAPVSDLNIIGNLAETENYNHNNGWHGGGWYHDFEEVKLSITSGSGLDENEKIQYKILSGDLTCTDLVNPIEIDSNTNIAPTVNSLSDGVYTLCYQAKDSAGNLEPLNKVVLKLDRTQPEYEILTNTINGSEVNGVYYIPSDTIELKVEGKDDHSGYFRTRYDLYTADENWNCTYSRANQVDLQNAVESATQTLTFGGLDDGRYCMRIWVYDDVQNISWTDISGLSTIHFVIDDTAPTASINYIHYPSKDVYSFKTNDNTPILGGTYYDNNRVSNITIAIGSDSHTPQFSNGNWISNEFLKLVDGKHTVTLTITDIAGNTSMFTEEITIDTTPPNAIYTHYNGDNVITDSIAFVKGVDQLSFTAEYDDPYPSSGLYQDSFVIFQAQDDGSFRFSADGKEAYCTWRENPNLVDTLEGRLYELKDPVPFTYCTTSLPDGEYYMAHQVYDSATRWDIPIINQFRDVLGLHFVVDATEPSVSITPSRGPDVGKWYSTRPSYSNTYPKFTISATDTNLDKVEYKWDDDELWNEYEGGDILYEDEVDGKHILYARATDLAGNVTEEELEVWFDFSNPEGSLTIDDTDGLVRQTVKLHFTDVQDPSGSEEINRIEVWVDDYGYIGDATKTSEGVYEYSLDTTKLSNGEHTIRPSIFDMAGNRTRPFVKITVDNVIPAINWNTPQDSDLLSGDITLDVMCDGTQGDCDYINFWWWSNDQTINDAINNKQYHYVHTNGTSFKWTLDSSNPQLSDGTTGSELNGEYTFRAAGKDLAGNYHHEEIKVIIDNTDPQIESLEQDIYNLSEGDDIPNITTTVTDETGLKKISYELENTDLDPFSGETVLSGTLEIVDATALIKQYAQNYFLEDITTIDTFYIPEGEYTITYWVEDMAGNTSSTETITVNISNVAPTIDSFTADRVSITEGDTVNFEAIFTDPSYIEYASGEKHADDASWIYSFNPEETYEPELSTNIPGETLSFSHTYNTEGTFVAEFMVCEDSLTDGEGQCANETVEITVSNNIPSVEITATDTELTEGDPAIVLTTTVTNGNPPFTYLWSGACTGTDAETIFNPTTEGSHTCTVTVTDADGDTSTDSVNITVGAAEENENTGEVLGAAAGDGSTEGASNSTTSSSKQPPAKTSKLPLGTGGYLPLSQTDLLDTEEQQIPEEETITEDTTAVKGEEDNNGEPTNEEETTQEEPTKWWIYPLVILPLLVIFLILWKRRKEEDEPQF